MIERIFIKNYAIIDTLELEFGKGFHVFTGETGAGKSIIVGALGLLLGEKGDASVIRTGSDRALIEASFSVTDPYTRDRLLEMNIDLSEGLIIKREVADGGKSRAFVNGQQETLARISEIGQWLLDVHGQHDHQLLLQQKVHIDILDSYAGLWGERAKIAEVYKRMTDRIAAKAELETDERKLAEEKVYWETAVKDISGAKFSVGEEEELQEQLKRMEHAEQINSALDGAYRKLYLDELSVTGRLAKAAGDIGSIATIDRKYAELAEILEGASAQIGEAVKLISEYTGEIDYDTGTMDGLTDRLELIKDLKRKYKKNTIAELNAYKEECAAKLARFENRAAELEKIGKEIDAVKKELVEKSLELSRKRQDAGKKLALAVKTELAFLGMEKSEFIAGISYVKDEQSPIHIGDKQIKAGQSGIDYVEFMISPNPGEDPRPLRKIASGGEISRVMLALKSILAGIDSIETLIFDEIDVGIGGVTANHVAQKIRELAGSRQLIVITHLPQIASKANSHYYVAKDVRDGKTYTQVRTLTEAERVNEVARMLGGESDTSIAHAKEMLGS
ncbi:MAG: DNA repair protein RecN [Spirochaetes bacterium GWF1_51_8]|nr:MAG: DNA repair protein RecN [Spirochaetes bacterium GWF1_51_8]